MTNHTTNRVAKYRPVFVMLWILLLVMTFGNAAAIDIAERAAWRNTLELQGSFNYARREVFRDLYGNGVTFALRYERIINDRVGLGLRASRVQLCNATEHATTKLKYRDFAVASMFTYNLARSRAFRFFSGVGAGLSFRKVTLESYSIFYSPLEAHQSEISFYSLLMLGADLRLSGSMFLGARVTYDRHFFGDVTTGDFGDTGGFNFGGSLGLRF